MSDICDEIIFTTNRGEGDSAGRRVGEEGLGEGEKESGGGESREPRGAEIVRVRKRVRDRQSYVM